MGKSYSRENGEVMAEDYVFLNRVLAIVRGRSAMNVEHKSLHDQLAYTAPERFGRDEPLTTQRVADRHGKQRVRTLDDGERPLDRKSVV